MPVALGRCPLVTAEIVFTIESQILILVCLVCSSRQMANILYTMTNYPKHVVQIQIITSHSFQSLTFELIIRHNLRHFRPSQDKISPLGWNTKQCHSYTTIGSSVVDIVSWWTFLLSYVRAWLKTFNLLNFESTLADQGIRLKIKHQGNE